MSVDHTETGPAPLHAVPGHRLALRWAGPEGVSDTMLTYQELLDQGRRAAAALRDHGVGPDDRVATLLPLIPESVVVTLACGAVDALRVSVPWFLSRHQLAARIRESGARVLIVADSAYREGSPYPVKRMLDRALADCPEVESVWVIRNLCHPVGWTPGRDRWWSEVLQSRTPHGED
ncbi:AMP-binding protein [Streptomyces sp. NPDC005438]|uniref:AMP-binding protein n=1 Tax=Streptomyces sp. NPDC005438 TaxID=3156880 RepID=UPI0033BA379A